VILVIHDANIIIDLQVADLLGTFFRLALENHTSDLVLDELDQPISEQIAAHQIKIKNWTSLELVEIALSQGVQPKPISIPDCSVLLLAQRLKGILLTGDANLRFCAEQTGVEVHGTLWIFDQLVAASVLPPVEAAKRLERLRESGRRLPEGAVNQRLHQWRKL
jgi:predicted nucleic acid-binding protein